MAGRYVTSHLTEDQYEPGSDGLVLRNLLHITDPDDMGVIETDALWNAEEKLLNEVATTQPFKAADICNMHRAWLGSIYPWAGNYRQVNISKGGFQFAMSHAIPNLMQELERNELKALTPCRFQDGDEVAKALAQVHVELMLIHPFREGERPVGAFVCHDNGITGGTAGA
jgi:cell filamentation protein